MRMGDHDYCNGNQHTFRQLYKDRDVTVEKCDNCDHMSVHIRDEDQENWCILRDGDATSAFKVGKTMGYQYGYNEGKADGQAESVEGEYDKGFTDGQQSVVGKDYEAGYEDGKRDGTQRWGRA